MSPSPLTAIALVLCACAGASPKQTDGGRMFVDGGAGLSRYSGPKFAIDAEGNDGPVMAAHLPGVQRRTIAGVSHWLMLDDPAAFDGALDEVLKQVGRS